MGISLERDFSYSVLMVSKIPLEDRGRRFVNQYLFEKTRFTDLNGLSPHTIARIPSLHTKRRTHVLVFSKLGRSKERS